MSEVIACQKCSMPMVLTQTNPDERGFENRVFDCPEMRARGSVGGWGNAGVRVEH